MKTLLSAFTDQSDFKDKVVTFFDKLSRIKPYLNPTAHYSIAELYGQIPLQYVEFNLERVRVNHGESQDEFFESFNNMKTSHYPKSIAFHRNKLITSFRIVSLLTDLLGSHVFANHLDICAGSGVMANTYKTLGFVKRSHCIDIVDRSNECDIDLYERLVKRFIASILDPQIDKSGLHSEQFSIPHHFCQPIDSPFLYSFLSQSANPEDILIAPYDKYVVGDFMESDPFLKESYNLITLYAGLEYFEPQSLFARVSELLAPSGYFFTVNDYFWESQGSSMHLPIFFPWLHILLEKEQLLQITKEVFGDTASNIIRHAYYFQQSHCTASNFVNIATNSGLKLVYQRRVPAMSVQHPSYPSYYPAKSRIAAAVSSFGRQIGFMPQDLDTYYLLQVFQKD